MSENPEKDETKQDYLKEFEKVINDLYRDINTTFPEEKLKPLENKEDYLELYDYCKLIYPKHFFNILYKNEDIFKEDENESEEEQLNFLPGINFKKLWNSNITDKTREIIWKYLQLILFLVVNSGDSENMFGEASELFQAIDQDEFKSKLEKTIGEMNDMFNNEEDSSGVEIPSAEDMHSHINGLLDGKLGALAKEIAEQTAKDLQGSFNDTDNLDNVDDVLEDGTYSIPRILFWLPELVGVKNHFVIMSIGVGLSVSFLISFILLCICNFLEYIWIPNLKSKFRKKYNQDPTKLEIVPDGEYSYYDEDDGSLLIKTYKHGKQHGPSYYHYNSGELWIEENHVNGKTHGTTKYYNKDGSTKKEETWKDGKYIK